MSLHTEVPLCFNKRLTRAEAVELILQGHEGVMCLEYGDEEVDEHGQPYWSGLTTDDINEDGSLDDDLLNFQLWEP